MRDSPRAREEETAANEAGCFVMRDRAEAGHAETIRVPAEKTEVCFSLALPAPGFPLGRELHR